VIPEKDTQRQEHAPADLNEPARLTLSPRSVILFITNTCDVACPTCNTGAQHDSGVVLSPAWTERFLRSLPQRDTWITWTGGEPFKAFDTLHRGLRIATERGFHSEILTSGNWYRYHPGLLERLAETGVFRLRISLDPEHQRVVPMDLVHTLVDDILNRRIPVGFTLRKMPGYAPAHTIHELIRKHPTLLQDKTAGSRMFHVIPTIPAGISASTGGNRAPDFADKPCRRGFRDLVIGPDGRVYPCCGLFGLGIDDMVCVSETPFETTDFVHDIINARSIFRRLLQDGPYRLALQNSIIPDRLPVSGYTCQCHACRLILKTMAAPGHPDHRLFERRQPGTQPGVYPEPAPAGNSQKMKRETGES
jgi:pyruvate-formate lyase-activating enzyme